MLLSRLASKVTFNWKYAAGEIVLIFIGISLSLFFDEWRTNRHKAEDERAHLSILLQSVEADINAASSAYDDAEETHHRLTHLISRMTAKAPLDDSTVKAFAYIVNNPIFEADKAGIHNIEASGLTVISDLKIRLAINHYYNRVQSNEQWARDVERHIAGYIEQFVMSDFKDFHYLIRGIPADYNKLINDFTFVNAVKRLHRLNNVTRERMESQRRHARDFAKQLRAYITNREP